MLCLKSIFLIFNLIYLKTLSKIISINHDSNIQLLGFSSLTSKGELLIMLSEQKGHKSHVERLMSRSGLL